MSESQKVAGNTVVQIVGRVVAAILAIFTLSLILRSFGAELQGRYLLAMVFAQFVSTIADFGLGTYLVKAISAGSSKSSQGMVLRFITAIPFYLLAVVVSLLLPYDLLTRQAIWIALFSAFVISMNNALVVYYQAKLRMYIPVMSEVFNKISVYVLTAVVIAIGLPFLWAVTVVALGALLNFALNFVIGKDSFPYKSKVSYSVWPSIFKESLPIWVVSVLILIYFRIDTILLSTLSLPDGQNNLVVVGYYSTAYKFIEMLIAIPMMFYGAVLPIIVARGKNYERIKTIIQKSFYAMMFFAIPISIITYFNSSEIINLFFPNYQQASVALSILIWGFLLSSISTGFYFLVISQGKQSKLVWFYVAATIINIGLNIWLIPKYGFYGAAWTTVLTEALILLTTYGVARNLIGSLSLLTRLVLKVLFASTLLIVAMYLLSYGLLINIVIGLSIYISVMYLIKGIDVDGIKRLVGRYEQ